MTTVDVKLAAEGFKFLASLGKEAQGIIDSLGLMPNVKFPTMGGNVVWNTLLEENGWKIQRNSITRHCRIIDPDNKRHAWGSEEEINEFFKKLVDVQG